MPNAVTKLQFSLTIEIGGKPIPLKSGDISSLPSPSDAKNALDGLIAKGLSFSTPADYKLQLPLSDLQEWLTNKGFDLPSGLTGFLDQTLITIYHASVSTKGEFSFSFAVDFKPALSIPDIPSNIFSVDEIGLAVSHTPASTKPKSGTGT